MPIPMAVTVALLIGWPLLQLASVLFVRGRRLELRRLAEELACDARYGRRDRQLVEEVRAEARGSAFSIAAPITLPMALLAAAIGKLVGRGPTASARDPGMDSGTRLDDLARRIGRRDGSETIQHDPRFERAEHIALEIGILRWPASAVLTALFCLPVLPIYGAAYGLGAARSAIPRGVRLLSQSATLASLGLAAAAHPR